MSAIARIRALTGRWTLSGSLALCLVAGQTTASAAPTDPHVLAVSDADHLSTMLAKAVERDDAPGVVALVVSRSNVIYQGTAGRLGPDHGHPIPADAIFKLASMMKPITSVAAMMLVANGQLSLDDPVSKYLPGFEHLQVITAFNAAKGSYETRPASQVMTVRHLMTHTSGIGYAFTSPILNQLQERTHKNEWELPLLHDPGAKWTYGPNTRLLGMIVEKVSGQSLEDFFQEHIFRPLHMTDTSYAVPKSKQPRVVAAYQRVDHAFQPLKQGSIPATPKPPFPGDGGLYSTAGDYGRFIQMLLNEGRYGDVQILSAEAVRLMGENQIGALRVEQQTIAIPAFARPFPLGAGCDQFGLGFQITCDKAGSGDYRSPGSLSWAGLFNTEFWIDPARGVGAVMMMQFLPFYDEGAIKTLREFETALYQALRVPAAVTPTAGTSIRLIDQSAPKVCGVTAALPARMSATLTSGKPTVTDSL